MNQSRLRRILTFFIGFYLSVLALDAQDVRELRIAFHVFNDDAGFGNFQPDSVAHLEFLHDMIDWINHRMTNLEKLKPETSSPFVKSMNLIIRLDTIFFHRDTYAWDCSDSLDSEYMRRQYVDKNTNLSYLQKHQTLPILLGDNHPVVGGHVSEIGSKRLIAMRGMYTMFSNFGKKPSLYECGRNIFHEIGHALGLHHNFSGGPSGDQCDQCEDNGCPQEGTSNNLMDYWPGYGGGISVCQLEIVNRHLSGEIGTISEVLVNDSCYFMQDEGETILTDLKTVTGLEYLRQNLIVDSTGRLEVSGTLSVNHGLQIIVRPGGQIDLKGGEITNLCGDLWAGITFISPTDSLPKQNILENGIIANASTGVQVSHGVNLILSDLQFINCELAVDIQQNYQGHVSIENSSFSADTRIHRYEQGKTHETFIQAIQSNIRIENNYFIHQDKFLTLAPGAIGSAVFCIDSRALITANQFRNMSIAVELMNEYEESIADITQNEFIHCVQGVVAQKQHQAIISENQFKLIKYDNVDGLGIYVSESEWILIQNNQFSSDFGGDHITGVYLIGNHEGTRICKNNTFENLAFGILTRQMFDQEDWMYSLSPKGLGLVLDGNSYTQVRYQYTSMTAEGYGLSKSGEAVRPNPDKFRMALKWPIGGLYLLSQKNSAGLFLESQKAPVSSYPQHNFFVNLLSDSMDPIGIDSYGTYRDSDHKVFRFSQPETIQEYQFIARHFRENPELLRDSRQIEKLSDFEQWPIWAIYDMISLSERATNNDSILSRQVTSLAARQLDSVIALPESNYPVELMDHNFQSGELRMLNFPSDYFVPGIPSENQKSEFLLYPNPANNTLFILPEASWLSHDRPLTYTIHTTSGAVVSRGEIWNVENLELSVNHLTNGLYIFNIRNQKEFLGRDKFVIFR